VPSSWPLAWPQARHRLVVVFLASSSSVLCMRHCGVRRHYTRHALTPWQPSASACSGQAHSSWKTRTPGPREPRRLRRAPFPFPSLFRSASGLPLGMPSQRLVEIEEMFCFSHSVKGEVLKPQFEKDQAVLSTSATRPRLGTSKRKDGQKLVGRAATPRSFSRRSQADSGSQAQRWTAWKAN
jgi:hypothetical protein